VEEKSRKLNGKTCSNEILNAISSAQKRSEGKKKKKDFRNNINFLIPHVCLSLNIPRNQPDPDEGRGGDTGER
jgi:hypothetical protein